MSGRLNWPTVTLELNTTRDPNDPAGSDTWVSIATYATEITTRRGRADELADVQAGTMDLTLVSDAGRFDPSNASGPYYPNLLAWRQSRLRAQWAPTGNLLDVVSASAETGIGGWVAANGNTTTPVSTTTNGAQSGTHNISFGPTSGTQNIEVVTDNAKVLVAPNTVYTGMAYVSTWSTLRNYAVSIRWFDSTGTFISEVQVQPDAGESAGWNLKYGTLTSPSNATYASIGVAIRSAAENHSVDCAGIFQGTVSTWAAGSGVISSVFRGYEETFWPQSWTEGGTKSWCKPTFIDAFAALGKIDLLDCPSMESLTDVPLALYPLSDSAGAPAAGNISGTKQSNAVVTPANVSDATFAFGQSSFLPGASGLSCFHIDSGANAVIGPYLTLPPGAVPAVAAGCTFEWWFDKASFANTLQMFAGQIPTDAAALAVYASASSGGSVVAFMRGAGGGGAFTAFSNPITPGAPTHVAVTLNAAGTQITLYVNGVNVGTASSGTIAAFSNVQFGGVSVPVSESASFSLLTTYNTVLSGSRILAHYQAGASAFAGEVPSAHITRLLSYASWLTALENIDTTSVGDANSPQVGLVDIGGKNLLQALKDISNGVLADLDIDGDGKVRYRSRDARLVQTTPVYTFGENTAAGELPYTDLPETGAKPDYLFSQVQVDQVNGITALRGDATANLRYFPTTLSKTTYLQDPAMVLDLADHLLRMYKDPHERAASFVLDPASNANLWPAVLGMDFGTRIRVMRRAPNGAVKTIDCYVESIAHHINFAQGVWQTTITTSAAPPFFPWILGDSTYSVLGSTTTPVF